MHAKPSLKISAPTPTPFVIVACGEKEALVICNTWAVFRCYNKPCFISYSLIKLQFVVIVSEYQLPH